jgi:hypothetical protein
MYINKWHNYFKHIYLLHKNILHTLSKTENQVNTKIMIVSQNSSHTTIRDLAVQFALDVQEVYIVNKNEKKKCTFPFNLAHEMTLGVHDMNLLGSFQALEDIWTGE